MPAIKKKWIKANQEVNEAETNENNHNDDPVGEEDKDASIKGMYVKRSRTHHMFKIYRPQIQLGMASYFYSNYLKFNIWLKKKSNLHKIPIIKNV